MALPPPEIGLVVRYSYLWHHEAMRGLEEGQKDRPCVIVLASKDDRVVVAPITHTPPIKGGAAVELPPTVKAQLGLDHERSWVVTNDVNHFQWPGADLRPVRGKEWSFGKLTPDITKTILQEVDHNARERRLKQVNRDDVSPVWRKVDDNQTSPTRDIKPLPKKDKDWER
jgi:PemK-like, MazF-like toxin of type II toxin-antitoxin system